MYSIRNRLLWTFCISLLLAGIAATYMTFISARAEVDRFLDVQLEQIALSVATTATNASHATLTDNHDLVIQVIDPDHPTFDANFTMPAQAGFITLLHDGEPWRAYAHRTEGNRVVVVAQPVQYRLEMAFSSALHILQPLVLLLPFLVLAIWLLVTQGLASLNRTAKLVDTRSSTDLEPLPTKTLPTEVKHLVDALNDLLARLKDSLETQKRFASDAAHELRTPLTAIKLQVQLAQRAKTPETQKKALMRLETGIDRATILVEQLLTIARLDPDAHKKPFEAFDPSMTLKSVAEELGVLAQQKNIKLSVDAPLSRLMGMEEMIKLVLVNLCDNAIRYTQEDGHIVLRLKENEDSLTIEVSDNGPGIAPEERTRVFDRFYRTLGTKTQGNGLGLAIVKRVIEIHHGTIDVDDGLDGRGTTMRITLPIRNA